MDYEPLSWQKGLGYRVDKARCRASVHEGGRGVGFHQCLKKPMTGERYCSVHLPANVKKRQDDNYRRYQEREAADKRRRIAFCAASLIKALRQIANGHNDPRALAIEVLEREGFPPRPSTEGSFEG